MSEQDTIIDADIDETLLYTDVNRRDCKCRMRVWHDRRFVVVTELDDNEGMSVTNAIESVAAAVERRIDGSCGVTSPEIGYRLVEHYAANSHREATFDVVTFGTRMPTPAKPHWRSLAQEHEWLVDSVTESR